MFVYEESKVVIMFKVIRVFFIIQYYNKICFKFDEDLSVNFKQKAWFIVWRIDNLLIFIVYDLEFYLTYDSSWNTNQGVWQ